jgi:hypothetical protein
LPICIVALLAETCTLKSKKRKCVSEKEVLEIWISYLVCAPGWDRAVLPVHWSCRVGWVDVAGLWVWSPFAVVEALHGMGGEEVKVSGTPHIISDVDFEWAGSAFTMT